MFSFYSFHNIKPTINFKITFAINDNLQRINQTTSKLQSFSSSKVPNARDPRNTGKYEIYSRRTSRHALSRSCSDSRETSSSPGARLKWPVIINKNQIYGSSLWRSVEKPNSKGGPKLPRPLVIPYAHVSVLQRRPRNDLECLVRHGTTQVLTEGLRSN